MKIIGDESIEMEDKIINYYTQLMEIDLETMDGLTADLYGDPKYWYDLCFNHRKTWRTFVDEDDQACGYFHFQAMKPHIIEQVRQGDFDESTLVPEDMYTLDKPGEYTAYCIGIALREDVRTIKNLIVVFKEFYACLEKLAQQGIFFKEWYADAMTKEGANLCEKFGMVKIKDHHEAGSIYFAEKLKLPRGIIKKDFPHITDYYER